MHSPSPRTLCTVGLLPSTAVAQPATAVGSRPTASLSKDHTRGLFPPPLPFALTSACPCPEHHLVREASTPYSDILFPCGHSNARAQYATHSAPHNPVSDLASICRVLTSECIHECCRVECAIECFAQIRRAMPELESFFLAISFKLCGKSANGSTRFLLIFRGIVGSSDLFGVNANFFWVPEGYCFIFPFFSSTHGKDVKLSVPVDTCARISSKLPKLPPPIHSTPDF